jgi:carboxylesterase
MIRDMEFRFPGGGNCGVLLIHGLTGTPTEMRTVGRGLSKEGFTTLGVQLAGHCGTEADLLATRWQDWFASVEAAAERLRGEVDHLFVAGLSMGAVLALKYAIEHPDKVDGLALYSTTFQYDGWAIPPLARLSFLLPVVDRLGIGRRRRFMETFPYGIKNERIRGVIAGEMLAGDSAAAGLPGNPWPSLAELFRLCRSVRRDIAKVRAPTLILHAKEDDVSSLRNAEIVRRGVSGPVELVELAESYHMITVDQERQTVIDRSAGFFRAQVPEDQSRLARRMS